ncbi:MAG: OmpP1/FadL family transporter [bacterium]
MCANTGSIYGLGTIAPAMGNAYIAHPDDPSATYYNPAGLTLERGNDISLGLTYFYPAVWIKGIEGVRNYIDNDKVLSFTLGIDTNLGHMTDYKQLSRFSFGLLIYTPPDRAYSVHAIPISDQSYALYKDTASQLMLLLGLGYRVTSFLDIGVSALLYMPGKMTTLYYLNTNTSPPNVIIIENRDLTISAVPEVGIIIKPFYMMDIGAVYRLRNSSGLSGLTTFLINNTPTATQPAEEKIVTTPDQIAIGVSITPSSLLRLNADVTYNVWSNTDVTDTQDNFMGGTDTITPAIGVEYYLTHRWTLRAGYSYSPSPFSTQSSDTNYVDADKHIYSAGAGYKFRLPRSHIKTHVDMFIQLQQLVERENNKSQSYMSYSNGGFVWSSGLSVGFEL